MIVCDLDGNKIEGPPGGTRCCEVKIHSAIFKNHPEIQSVVHVHPRYTVLMSVLGQTLVPMCQEGANLVTKPIPVWPHSRLVSTDEDGEGLSATLGDSPVALLIGHGAVATGSSISQSISNIYTLEEQARMNYWAFQAMGPDHPRIPDELVQENADNPAFWQLPHFQSSIPEGTTDNPHRQVAGPSGPYKYWASQVEDGALSVSAGACCVPSSTRQCPARSARTRLSASRSGGEPDAAPSHQRSHGQVTLLGAPG